MGERKGWAHVPLNGLVMDESANGNVTRVLDQERWTMAERRIAQLIECIQPNQPSNDRRNAVSNYVTRLIMNCFPCRVCAFGSVPLKTYLPDGDIDLTALTGDNDVKETWANKVRYALECEEKNPNAEFNVKEVQFIQAEVKIIKCLVENIVVDISFNQVGGLCTLCFLEEADRLISHSHLFKSSILLIKAWCYYESRILGAHHGLISTYALETLVLYIFHIYNNKFAGPLEVLFRFLEFFGKFDWENYCVSLWGPVPISSLPNMIAESPRRDDEELLLSKAFLDWCAVNYSAIPNGQDTQIFSSKFLNVIDPLRTSNNLGRSVGEGNFFRIRSALAFGAKKLASLLECRKEEIITELNHFFRNTWERHGTGIRPDCPRKLPNPSQIQKIPSTIEGNNNSKNEDQKAVKPNRSLNTNTGVSRLQFARTRSSPDLTNPSNDSFPRGRRSRAADLGKKQAESENSASISSNHSTKSLFDEIPRPFNNASDTNSVRDTSSVVSNYDNGFGSASEDIGSMEEQDMVNIMGMHGFNGQFQLPAGVHQNHHHLPLAFSSLLGNDLNNLSLIGRPWSPNMQFPPGFISPPVTPAHYSLNQMVGKEKINTIVAPNNNNPEVVHDNNAVEEKYDNSWRDNTASTAFRQPNRNRENPNLVPVSLLPIQTRFRREDLVPVRENQGVTGWTDASSSVSSRHSRGSSRPVYDNSSRNNNNNRSPREKWARKPVNNNPVWKNEITAEDCISEFDGESADWASTSAGEENSNNNLERIPHMAYDPALNAGFPTGGPVLLDPSGQRVLDNSGRVFIPTGPPIPFYVFNYKPEMPNHPREEIIGNQISNHNNPDLGLGPSVSASPSANSDERNKNKSDILYSDLERHLENLMFGRLCINNPYHASLLPQSPFMVPQMLFPSDGGNRPILGNLNLAQFPAYGPRLIPLMPLQPGAERVHNVQRFVEEPPRSRVGTGTYLPNPATYRERQQQPNSRNQRWNNNNDNNTDREGNWTSSKQRGSLRRGNSRNRQHHHHHQHPMADNQSDGQWQTYRNEPYRHEDNINRTNNNSSSTNYPLSGPKLSPGPRGQMYHLAPPSVPNGVVPVGPVMVYSYDQQQRGGGYNNVIIDEVNVQQPELRRGELSRSSPETPTSPNLRTEF